jgi:hypothetical protein
MMRSTGTSPVGAFGCHRGFRLACQSCPPGTSPGRGQRTPELEMALGFGGSYIFSALVCPIWFVTGVVRSVLQRPSWGVAAARILIPVVMGLLAVEEENMSGAASIFGLLAKADLSQYH